MGKRISEFFFLVFFHGFFFRIGSGGAWLVLLCCGNSVLGTVCRNKKVYSLIYIQ